MFYNVKGEEMLTRLAEDLNDISTIESKPTMEGRRMIMVLSPSKNK
jgi:translation initiation factor IF-3